MHRSSVRVRPVAPRRRGLCIVRGDFFIASRSRRRSSFSQKITLGSAARLQAPSRRSAFATNLLRVFSTRRLQSKKGVFQFWNSEKSKPKNQKFSIENPDRKHKSHPKILGMRFFNNRSKIGQWPSNDHLLFFCKNICPTNQNLSICCRSHNYRKAVERFVVHGKTQRAPPFMTLVEIVRPVGRPFKYFKPVRPVREQGGVHTVEIRVTEPTAVGRI